MIKARLRRADGAELTKQQPPDGLEATPKAKPDG
jgi:hypothetical protein